MEVGIRFRVSDTEYNGTLQNTLTTLDDWVLENDRLMMRTLKEIKDWKSWRTEYCKESGGTLLKSTTPDGDVFQPQTVVINGFVEACIMAYNTHCELAIKPDDIWIAIIVALSGYIDRNSEDLRSKFVVHDGQTQLTVHGEGTVSTADYDALVDRLCDLIDENTVENVKDWFECNFSTTTKKQRTTSKLVLMGAVKNYISYKMKMLCGLPSVMLMGTVEDWIEIRSRVERLSEWGLEHWQSCLVEVLDHFVDAFERPDNIDCDWWNRIAHIVGGGSGPTYYEGWMNTFIGWNDKGDYILSKGEGSKPYGRIDSNDIPSGMSQVPVIVDDNGKKYEMIFCAGNSLPTIECHNDDNPIIGTSNDWVMINVTDCRKK